MSIAAFVERKVVGDGGKGELGDVGLELRVSMFDGDIVGDVWWCFAQSLCGPSEFHER